jgi:FdhE protein
MIVRMPETWRRRVQRAQDLAAGDHPSKSLLAFYATLLDAQAALSDGLRARFRRPPSGAIGDDLPIFHLELPLVLQTVVHAAPEPLADEARQLLDAGIDRLDRLLVAFWQTPSDRQFFAKAMVQPYAQWLAETGVAPIGRPVARADNRCPFCGGAPQLSLLRGSGDPALQGGSRALQCSTCLTTWPFRRILCAYCGEEDERKLEYFESPAFDHIRVEACDTCKRYLKGIDLTRLGLAVPLVDEVAGAPLDAWACDRGYTKIELNLVGL